LFERDWRVPARIADVAAQRDVRQQSFVSIDLVDGSKKDLDTMHSVLLPDLHPGTAKNARLLSELATFPTKSSPLRYPTTQPPHATREVKWGQGGGPRPKNSNAAVGSDRDRATQKAQEGYDRQTNKQTNFLRIIVRLPAVDRNRVLC